jgi:hypothetical protein
VAPHRQIRASCTDPAIHAEQRPQLGVQLEQARIEQLRDFIGHACMRFQPSWTS